MAIQQVSENVLLVDLPQQDSQIAEQLHELNEYINNTKQYDIIIDFFRVEIVTSSNLSNLLILRGMLQETECRLVLCNVSTVTSYIFKVAGLKKIFEFTDNKLQALAQMQSSGQA